jgi:hypothetical protein
MANNPIYIALGDYGRPIPITLYPKDGYCFSVPELTTANYNLVIYRTDRAKQPVEIVDTELIPNANNGKLIHYYKVGQQLKLGDELVTISAVDLANQKLTITRAATPLYHKRGEIIRHIISESATAVAWNPVTHRVEITLENNSVDYKGNYDFEIEVDTGTRFANVMDYALNNPFKLVVYDDPNT